MPSTTSLAHMHEGQMDTPCLGFLINSISRFIHLVTCQIQKPMPIYKNYVTMVSVLKLLKPVLDEVISLNMLSDEHLYEECEKLDVSVNEAREYLENWSPKMSKICSVLKSESLLINIQSSSIQICQLLNNLQLESSIQINIQCCMQKIQFPEQGRLAEYIKEALRSERDDIVPSTDHILKIIESLSLTSSQEILKERMALEKEKLKPQKCDVKEESDQVDRILNLVLHIRSCLVKREQSAVTDGLLIPPYFCCPLSSELMLDPVIVASGQTYDRRSIEKWLDSGLRICPKTRQMLTHTNLIPNHTVKAMIANWCEANNIEISNHSDKVYPVADSSPTYRVSSQTFFHTDSFRSSHSTSRSSFDVGNGSEKQKVDASCDASHVESNGCWSGNHAKFDHQSLGRSCTHSRSESGSSVASSIHCRSASNEFLKKSSKTEHPSECSGEIKSECPSTSTSNVEVVSSSSLSGNQCSSSETMAQVAGNGNHNNSRMNLNLQSEDTTTISHVEKLVEALKSQSNEVQASAAAELRHLAKDNMNNRIIIGQCGAIVPLLFLLRSKDKLIQEHAVTALLNLSIHEKNKAMIAEAGAIEPLIHVLKSGNSGAKENSAAALFSLSLLEDHKAKIGRSGAIKALVDLLGSGTLRGKKDAATALFNLSIFHENKARIVQAGAVKYLVKLLDPASEMVDKAVALLANLSTIREGQVAIAREGGIPLLVEIVESGSQRGKENAASVLLQLCLNSPKVCTVVLQEGAVPPLVALSQSGTTRAKEKAQQLLSHFRNHREGAAGKGKSK